MGLELIKQLSAFSGQLKRSTKKIDGVWILLCDIFAKVIWKGGEKTG
jgi:hypothetical protein